MRSNPAAKRRGCSAARRYTSPAMGKTDADGVRFISKKVTRMNNLDDILKLLRALAELPFETVEVTDGGVSVRVSRGNPSVSGIRQSAAPAAQAASELPAASAGPSEDRAIVVSSPIIGVFYVSPSPEDAPFVQEGAAVGAGQTLCIVEAMKLMNEIPSPVSGTVVKVLAQDGGEVEVGQALFLIEPAEA
jgi:acetyl-CoA carboxylase biotin carboxyl carrier protein